jgi:hypothetical protein
MAFAMALLGTIVAWSFLAAPPADAQPAPPRPADAPAADLRAHQTLAVSDNVTDRVQLVAGPDNTAALRIFDRDGQLRVHVEMTEEAAAGVAQGIALWNGTIPIVRMGSVGRSAELAGRQLSAANLVLRDDTGKDRIRLLVADNGTPSLELIGDTETLVWTVQ